MSELFYKDEVARVHPDARCACLGWMRPVQYAVMVGRGSRYLSVLSPTPKDAWESAYSSLAARRPGIDSGQLAFPEQEHP